MSDDDDGFIEPPGFPDQVECHRCHAKGDIRERAEITLRDNTPDRALRGAMVTYYHCRPCFKLFNLINSQKGE